MPKILSKSQGFYRTEVWQWVATWSLNDLFRYCWTPTFSFSMASWVLNSVLDLCTPWGMGSSQGLFTLSPASMCPTACSFWGLFSCQTWPGCFLSWDPQIMSSLSHCPSSADFSFQSGSSRQRFVKVSTIFSFLSSEMRLLEMKVWGITGCFCFLSCFISLWDQEDCSSSCRNYSRLQYAAFSESGPFFLFGIATN